jgi:tRNA uridine 5-carbamoylmethylation protein Kti12
MNRLYFTNLSSRRRKYNLSFFDSSYYKVSVTFPILKDEEYIYRNNTRKKENNKDISLGVIKSMLKKYTPPNKEEGFDLCIYV